MFYGLHGESGNGSRLRKAGWRPLQGNYGLWEKDGKLRRPDEILSEQSEGAGPTPTEPTDDFFQTLEREHGDHWVFQDPVAAKRLRDLLRDAQSAQATSPAENARLEQSSPTGASPSKDPIFDDEVEKDEGGALRVKSLRRL